MGRRDSWRGRLAESVPAGPSTNIAGVEAVDATRPILTKAELVQRVRAFAARRSYTVKITAAWYDDLVKDGLAPASARVANKGKAPQYGLDAAAYRVALQIARMYHQGVFRRDEISLLLFIRGYRRAERCLRADIISVQTRIAASIRKRTRSSFARNYGTIPNGYSRRLLDELAPPSEMADLRYRPIEADELIRACRDSLQKPIFTDDRRIGMGEMAIHVGSHPDVAKLWPALELTIHGLLMPPEVGDARDRETVAGMVKAARTASIEMAGAALRNVVFRRSVYADLRLPSELVAPIEELCRLAQFSPYHACIGLVAAIQVIRLFKDFPHYEAFQAVADR